MSKQRQAVLDVVTNSCDHPTAETILYRCKQIIPSMNLATVYRNLKELVKQGKVNKISQEEGDRFDKTLVNHAHFKCINCSNLTDLLDIDVDAIKLQVENEYGVKINISSVSFSGICDNCLNVVR